MSTLQEWIDQKEFRKKNKGKGHGTKIGVCEICRAKGDKLYNQELHRHEYYGGRDRLNINNKYFWICDFHNQLLESYSCEKWLETQNSYKCQWKHCKFYPDCEGLLNNNLSNDCKISSNKTVTK